MVLATVLFAYPIGARAGILLAGLFLAVPCFVWAPPLFRALLMCFAFLPLLIAAIPILAPSIVGFRARLTFFCTWFGTREVKRRMRSFDTSSLLQLVLAMLAFAAATTTVIAVPASGLWLLARWLAGGIMILAFAEMATAVHNFQTAIIGLTAPALLLSPYLSVSVSEFWNKRWNPGASLLCHDLCFVPLARHGVGLAMFATFLASGVGHTLLVFMAIGNWTLSLLCGAFFVVQSLFIVAERWMKVRRWRPAAGRTWTLTVLAITLPLFVEPMLQIVESSWGKQDNGLWPTLAVLAFAIIVDLFFSLAALASCSTKQPADPLHESRQTHVELNE